MISLLLQLVHLNQLRAIDTSNPYEFDESMRLASEKVMAAEESMGFGSGTAIFGELDFQLPVILFAIIIGVISFFTLMIILKKRKP